MTACWAWSTSCWNGWRAATASSTSTPRPGRFRNLPGAVDHAIGRLHDLGIPGHRPDHLLLDDEIGRGDIEMQRGDAGDRAERIVWRDADARGFRHRGDLARLGQAAGMADIGLGDMHGVERNSGSNSPRSIRRSPVAIGTGERSVTGLHQLADCPAARAPRRTAAAPAPARRYSRARRRPRPGGRGNRP